MTTLERKYWLLTVNQTNTANRRRTNAKTPNKRYKTNHKLEAVADGY